MSYWIGYFSVPVLISIAIVLLPWRKDYNAKHPDSPMRPMGIIVRIILVSMAAIVVQVLIRTINMM